MAKHRAYGVEFKRQVTQEFLVDETLHGLAKRHDFSRNLIRAWVERYEAGVFDEDARAADIIQEYEARIAAFGRLVGKQAATAAEAIDILQSAGTRFASSSATLVCQVTWMVSIWRDG